MQLTKDFSNWPVIIGYPNPESYQSHDQQEILHLLRGRPDLRQVRGDGGALCQVSMKLLHLLKGCLEPPEVYRVNLTEWQQFTRYYKPNVIFVGVGDHSRNGEDPGEILAAIMSITPHPEFRFQCLKW